LGLLPPRHATALTQVLPLCEWAGSYLVWDTDAQSASTRSASLQAALGQLRDQGLLPGWRDEKFSFWDTSDCQADNANPPFLSVERSGFRFLGMMSHAVHVNGFLEDGRVWCGRRSLQKATDPGLLDNLAAGGLAAGETILSCAVRELSEEAGLDVANSRELQSAGSVRISRSSELGWHDETLHVFNLRLPDDFRPVNRDGEVAEFVCLMPDELVECIGRHEFTPDAALALAQGLELLPKLG